MTDYEWMLMYLPHVRPRDLRKSWKIWPNSDETTTYIDSRAFQEALCEWDDDTVGELLGLKWMRSK